MASFERDQQAGERTRGPGRWLRQIRERRRLDTAEVAGALHLDRRTLEALEADDYASLPPATFVRGYLRAYARHLGQSEDDVLEAFDRLGLNKRRPLSAVGDAGRRGPMTGLGVPLVMGMLAVLVAGGGWLLWSERGALPPWLSSDSGTAATMDDGRSALPSPASPEPFSGSTVIGSQSDPTAPQAADGSGPGDRPDPEQARQSGDAEGSASSVTVSESEQSLPGARDAALAETERDTVTEGRSESPAAPNASSPTVAESPPAADAAATETGADAPAAMADASTPAPAATRESASEPMETLSFRFSGEAWMEVVDARGERLLFGLVTEPGEREVRGVPPFRIVIGDVSRVSMERGGRAVALDPYTRGRVARFELEARGDVASR